MNLSKFPERLSELLFEAQLNPPVLAEAIGCTRGTINRYLNGSLPTLEMAVRLADYFGCTVDFLLGVSEENEVKNFVTPPPFCERLPVLLKEFNKSRYSLQKSTNISDTIMRYWWKGIKVPSIDSIAKIAEALDCSIDYVIGRSK
ncbi:MAG: helix-turn-helix domain-containing protein [Clostridiales bacterium]|nr:helix-turn-helix domain-containing protein [Clostridiales bacterium]